MNYAEQMRQFGECNFGAGFEAICEPGEFISLDVIGGTAIVTVDCYMAMREIGLFDGQFDVDLWDDYKLLLVRPDAVPIKAFWKEAFRTARALLNGWEVQIGDEPPLSIGSHVSEVRSRRTIKIKRFVTEEEIAETLGCSVAEVRERAEREGWAYCLEGEPGQPLIPVTPASRH